MSISEFLRVLWARRLLIVLSTVICAVAAIITVEVVRPRYEAQSRIMLDIIKPDPVTGEIIATAFLRAYTKTQVELVKDQEVARRVVRDLRWAEDPAMQRAYRDRNRGMGLDFERWAAARVMEGASARLIEGSNVLEISYSTSEPARAKQVADALREAYVEMTLESRRENARRNAVWYEEQAEKLRAILFEAEASKANFERESGIILQDDKTDIDSARLAALASQGGVPIIAPSVALASPAAGQLASLDAQIAEVSKTLGPNHPQLRQLRTQRELLAAQVARDRNSASRATNAALSTAQATASLLEAQKAKVMAQRGEVERLQLMQDEIDLRRDQYNKAIARAGELRQEAEVAEAGVVPLGAAITPQTPKFPKKGLTIIGSIGGGLGLGVVCAILLEMFGRRIRSADDLRATINAPVLAIVRTPREPKASRFAWLHNIARRRPALRPRTLRA